MPKVIQQTQSGFFYVLSNLPEGKSVKQAVHDGDTVNVGVTGDFGVRFLGMDAPEVSFTLPGKTSFTSIKRPEWTAFLSDPFTLEADEQFSRVESDGLTRVQGSAEEVLGSGLMAYLAAKAGANAAPNHAAHAETAQRHLEGLAEQDRIIMEAAGKEYTLFLAFASEILDGFGRFLAFIDRDKTRPEQEAEPLNYNERMLADGFASPYFIWPNIDPFRKSPSRRAAVPAPAQLDDWLNGSAARRLSRSRQAIKQARTASAGIYGGIAGTSQGALQLEGFELRYLARRTAPSRYVLDLNAAGTAEAGRLLDPRDYYTVNNSEDRLFINSDDLPLFLERGYTLP